MIASPKLSIIAPCFNEEMNVLVLIERFQRARPMLPTGTQILLVDDGSEDKTWERIQECVTNCPDFVVGVRHHSNEGIVAAWRTGLTQTRAELVCLIDADLQNPPEAVPSLLAAFLERPGSLVQGIRTPAWRARDTRYATSRVFNALLNFAFRDTAKDCKSGFVLGERKIILSLIKCSEAFRYPQSFIRIAAIREGVPVTEVSTLFMERRAGQSFLDTRGVFRVSVYSAIDVLRAVRLFGRSAKPTAHIGITAGTQPLTDSDDAVARVAERPPMGLNWYFQTMPLHGWLIRPRVADVYSGLKQTQWLSREEVADLQNDRLHRLIRHAALNVPYYRRMFAESGISPLAVRSVEQLGQVPLLTKDSVRSSAHFDLFSAQVAFRDLHRIATSGSTGEPFVTYADRFQLEVRFASTIRALEWTGWRFGQRQLRLWHQKLGMSPTQAVRERFDALLMRRSFVPAFEMSEKSLEELVALIEAKRPALIDGYAESFNLLAQYISSGRVLKHSPQAIISSAQTLTAQTRASIESAFGCKVYDKYGAREFSGIAYQCGVGSEYHVMDESYVVEILRNGRPAKPGEVGEIVVTDLNNYSFPLIRYRIGDLAYAAASDNSCDCGRGLSRIGAIQGRTQALVHCANGRWLPGTFFAHFFKDYSHSVRHFQVVQNAAGSFKTRIVPGEFWNDATWNEIVAALRPFVGPTTLEFELVDQIPLLLTGKRTPVISSVEVDFQRIA